MANRRMGGMGGGHRGNRSFSQHQPFQGSNLSPWQGNMPSNNSVNQGLLSQLTSNPQQLALALTSLLQPQQQQMNNPPSLLSLNTSPAFSNQDRDFNRFGRGREFRRHEPYNKNRNGGWRAMDNKNRNNNKNRDNNRRRSPPKDQKNKKGDLKKNEKPVKDKEEKKKGDVIDLSTDEGNEEGNEETKRDWKDEKNNSEEKKADSGDEEEKKEPRNKEGPYSGVPVKFLNCFVCNKEMWDGESMQKHIRGRAHKQMLNSLEESIHITVNILRENMRLAEEKKVIEWNRMQRLQKYHKYNDVESHCNMCDLKFMGKIIVHRKTEGHQRLKRYLHPNCEMCDKEFPSRMEWVEHRLTPEHLRRLHETLKDKTGGDDGDLVIKGDELDLDLEPLLDESLQMEVDNPILELTDDMTGLQNLIPAYKPDRAVSGLSLKPFEGFMCQLCNRSFENEELSQAHLKTKRHYYQFIEAARLKYKQNSKKEDKKGETEANEEKDVKEETTESQNEGEGDADMYDPEEACKEEDVSMETSNDDGDPSVISLGLKNSMKEDVEEEAEADEKEEKPTLAVKEEPKTPSATPVRQTRMGGGVKNGAGPKSKKLAVVLSPAKAQEQTTKATGPSTFRIPKLNSANNKK